MYCNYLTCTVFTDSKNNWKKNYGTQCSNPETSMSVGVCVGVCVPTSLGNGYQ